MATAAQHAGTVEARAGASWALLPHFLIRSTGFPFELLDPLRLPATAGLALALVEADREIGRLGEVFEREIFGPALEAEQSAGADRTVFRGWYQLRRLVRRREPCPGGLTGTASASLWAEAWNAALATRDGAVERLDAAFTQELTAARSALLETTRDPAFEEALLLSNPDMARIGLASYRRHFDAARRPSKVRQLERRLWSYLQRFCTKNDTTSFFGPIDYGEVDPASPVPLALSRGPAMPSRRLTRLSYWAAQALADAIASEPALRPHLPFRLAGGCRLLPSGQLEVAGRDRPLRLGRDAVALLRLADGRHTARDVHRLEGRAVASRLEQLESAGVVVRRIEIPTAVLNPLGWLRERVAALPQDLVHPWPAVLGDMAEAVTRFGPAPTPAKTEILETLEAGFTRATGAAARRGHGDAYADRAILYDEARGDIASCTIGGPMLGDLRARLAPALDLCASYSLLVQQACQRRARDLLAQGGGPRSYLDFVRELQDKVSFEDCLRDHAVVRFSERLAHLAGSRAAGGCIRLHAADIEPLLVAVPAGTLVSPDIFLAASGPEAIARGDYQVVIGEVHYGSQVWCHFLALHDDIGEVERAVGRLLPAGSDGCLRAGLVHGRSQGKTFYLEPPGVAVEVRGRSLKAASDVIPVADLEVVPTGTGVALRSRSLGRTLRLHPGDGRAVANWVLGDVPVVLPPLRLGPHTPHTPRIEIGGTVVWRGRWDLDARAVMARLGTAAGAGLIAAAQELRTRHGLPERFFARVPSERKPFYVDVASLFSLEQLVAVLPGNDVVTLTELLPTPDQWWLRGPGTRSNEWRMTLVAGGPQA